MGRLLPFAVLIQLARDVLSGQWRKYQWGTIAWVAGLGLLIIIVVWIYSIVRGPVFVDVPIS